MAALSHDLIALPVGNEEPCVVDTALHVPHTLINPFIFTVDAVGTQSLFADGEGLGQIKAKKEVIFLHAGILVCTSSQTFSLTYILPLFLLLPSSLSSIAGRFCSA